MASRCHSISAQSAEHAGLHYICTYSCYDDGRLAEVFLNQLKTDSAADAFARDGAFFISIALQFGASLATLRRTAQRNPDGTASSTLGHALDLIAADIGARLGWNLGVIPTTSRQSRDVQALGL